MSTFNTPLSAFDATPLSTSFTTPQSHRPNATNTTPSPFPSTSRRSGGQSHLLSMYSTQDRIVLDIGARYIHAGFSGEAFPRCSIDASTKSMEDVFWEDQDWDAGLVEDRLERGLREVYSQYTPLRYLLIDSKTRKVIVAEPTLVAYRLKEAICRVLFTYFQVPSVTFLSSQVLALASTGVRTGLVIDIGWHDTRILPIYELRPLNPFIQSSPIACRALHDRLSYLLHNYTTPQLDLSFATIEDFLVRAVYTPPTPPTKTYPTTISSGLIPNESLKEVYSSSIEGNLEWFVHPHKKDVSVPKWIQSTTTELFFEGDRPDIHPDDDERCLVSSIILCLSRLPHDIRSKLLNAIIIVGGGAAIPGLRSRIHTSLERAWKTKFTIDDTERKGAKVLNASPLEATWQGGSLLGDIKVKGLVEVSREGFNGSQGRGVLDWSFVGGLGDEGVEESKRKSRG